MKLIKDTSIDSPLSDINVSLEGEFDANGCKEIREELESLVDGAIGRLLILDLENVSFIDSSGIGAIVFLYKRALENEGNLRLRNVTGQPQELITLLRVDKAIDVEFSNTNQAQAEA